MAAHAPGSEAKVIIRRRHTSNFTTIGNALFEDERLAADEVGILVFLLSRPNQWEVRRPALMRRWRIGRDAIKRIMTNLIRTGWCCAKKTRLSNGTFHIVYEIRDEPGRELSEEEVRGALSLVSSEVADGNSDDNTGGCHLRDSGDPPTGQPPLADHHTVTRRWLIEDSENTDLSNTESTQVARAFLDVRSAWPPEHVLSLADCEAYHAALADPIKEDAFQGIKPYLDECRLQNRKVCDLGTFYRGRRWERFTTKRAGPEAPRAIYRGMPQAIRWREWYAAHEPAKLAVFDQQMATGRGYTVPSEWPPAIGPREQNMLPNTLTDQEAREFTNG